MARGKYHHNKVMHFLLYQIRFIWGKHKPTSSFTYNQPWTLWSQYSLIVHQNKLFKGKQYFLTQRKATQNKNVIFASCCHSLLSHAHTPSQTDVPCRHCRSFHSCSTQIPQAIYHSTPDYGHVLWCITATYHRQPIHPSLVIGWSWHPGPCYSFRPVTQFS